VTLVWVTQIPDDKWRKVRAELEDNGISIPYTNGVVRNAKTGYTLLNRYQPETGLLEIKVSYQNGRFSPEVVSFLLGRLLDSPGEIVL